LRRQDEKVIARIAQYFADPGGWWWRAYLGPVLETMLTLGPSPADTPFFRVTLEKGDRHEVRLALEGLKRIGAAAAAVTPELVALLKRTGRSCLSRGQLEAVLAALRTAAPRDAAAIAAILAIGPGGAVCRGDADVLAWIDPFLPAATPEVIAALLGDSDRVTRRAARAILRSGGDVTAHLAKIRVGLKSKRPNQRVWCAILLARLDSSRENAAKTLGPALVHSCRWIRIEAVKTIGMLARERVGEALPLVRLLGDPDPAVASLAFETFVRARPPAERAVPALLEAIDDADSPFDRRGPMAFKALVTAYGDVAAKAVPHLVRALAREYLSPSVNGRWEHRKGLFWAADCLAQLGPASRTALDKLEAARGHDGVMVSSHASQAIAKIRGAR
jgi:HEAT repeat protein